MSTRKTELQALLKANANDVFLNYAWGLELKFEQNWNQAIQQFEKVLQLDSNYHPACYQLGQCYQELNDTARAASCFETGRNIAIAQNQDRKSTRLNSSHT